MVLAIVILGSHKRASFEGSFVSDSLLQGYLKNQNQKI